ncbi:hypothetical protein NMG60_11019448 [Bertholletia excelsa]
MALGDTLRSLMMVSLFVPIIGLPEDARNAGHKNSGIQLPDYTVALSPGRSLKETKTEGPGSSPPPTKTDLGNELLVLESKSAVNGSNSSRENHARTETPESSLLPTESAVSQSKRTVNGSNSDRDGHAKFSALNVSPGPRSSPPPTETPVVSQSKIAVNGSISRRGGHAKFSDSVAQDSSGGIPSFPRASSNVLITLFSAFAAAIIPLH